MAYGGFNKYMNAAAELGRNPVSKHQIHPEYGDDQLPKPTRETKFSGTNADRGTLIFPVQLTTSRIGNLTRLIHTLAICVTIHILLQHRRGKREEGEAPASKHQTHLGRVRWASRRGEGEPNPPRETKNSGANGGRNWRTEVPKDSLSDVDCAVVSEN